MRRRTLRTILIGVLVFLMTIDSATAFHLFGGGWRGGCGGGCGGGWERGGGRSHFHGSYGHGHRSYGCSSYGCGSYSSGSGYAMHSDGYSGGGCSEGGCSGCSGEVSGTYVDPAPEGIYQTPQQPATMNRLEDQSAPPRLPAETWRQPAGGDVESVPPVRTPQENFQPTTPRAVDTPAAGGDVFGPPARSGATTREGAAEKATSDDMFGPATPATPPQTPAGGGTRPTPADDLFGPTQRTPPTPVTPPQSTTPTPAGGADDIFGPTGTDRSAPTTPPAGGANAPAGGAQPEAGRQPTGDDLFGPTGGTSGADDLFAPTGGTSTPATTPTTPPTETTPPANDPFRSAEILRENGGLASEANREWADNTGQFKTRGRLVSFLDGHVRLMKDNGRTTTVPLYRLSPSDLEFVNRQANAQRDTQSSRTVQARADMPWSTN